jgi:hypothetical protein
MTKLLAALTMAVLLSAPLHADLKYTMTIDMHASTVPVPAPASPVTAMSGRAIVSRMAPSGTVHTTVFVSDAGTRVEYGQAYLIIPAGGVTIARPDGTLVVLDPARKTYWKTAVSTMAASGLKPEVTVHRTGDHSTIAGVPVERATLEISVPLPIPPGAKMPPGLPTELSMSGEAWLSDRYKAYMRSATGLSGGMGLFGTETLAAEGFVMKSILRGDVFAGQELEAVVTSIGEAKAPAGAFEIPAGYQEVPAPTALPVPAPQ